MNTKGLLNQKPICLSAEALAGMSLEQLWMLAAGEMKALQTRLPLKSSKLCRPTQPAKLRILPLMGLATLT